MACNCITETEEKALEMVAERHPKWTIKPQGYVFENVAYMFDSPHTAIGLPIKIVYTEQLKSGEQSREKKYHANIFMSYCPFCGVKYKD